MLNQIRRFIATKATKVYLIPSPIGYEASKIEKIGIEGKNPNIKTDVIFDQNTYQQVAKVTVPTGLKAMFRVTFQTFTCLGRLHHDIYPFLNRTYLIKDEQIIEIKKCGHADE